MKKILVIVLAAVMCVSLIGCDSSSSTSVSADSGDKTSTYKIAVAETAINDEAVNRRRYFTDCIAKNYPVEFVFSEAITEIDALITFIENSSDAGCKAFLDYSTLDYDTAARECDNYEMYYVYNGTKVDSLFDGEYGSFVAAYGSNQAQTGELFSNYLRENASDTGEEGFLVCSIGACQGNTAQITITTAVLEALQGIYGLTYEQDIENYVKSASPVLAVNDKGINIYVYPGNNTLDGWLPGLSSELQTGKYKFLISSGQSYTTSAVVVDEIERSMNLDIKVMSVGAMSQDLLDAYKTKDVFGNPCLDFVTVKAASQHAGVMFALAYNALTGHEGNNKYADGSYSRITFNQFGLTTEEMVSNVAAWDNAETGTWVASHDIVEQMLGINNEDLTGEDIQEIVDGITYESVADRLAK